MELTPEEREMIKGTIFDPNPNILENILENHFEPTCGQKCHQTHFDHDLSEAKKAILSHIKSSITKVKPKSKSAIAHKYYNQAKADILLKLGVE